MKISKAILTVAKPDQRALPLQRLVDRQGIEKSALQLNLDEIAGAGIADICVVIGEGDDQVYRRAAGEHAQNVRFIQQTDPQGYGDAIYRAKDFVGDEPFLHVVGDHLYLSRTEQSCASQIVQTAEGKSCSVSAVQPTRESSLPYFGAIGGTPFNGGSDLFKIHTVIEKPTPTEAEQRLIVAGMRTGYYLCLFGMHVLTPQVMEILGELLKDAPAGKSPTLSDALLLLAERERYLALNIAGGRYDIGVKYGVLFAQLAHALSGRDRDRVLTEMLGMLTEIPAGSDHGENLTPQHVASGAY